jgi:type I restriction enzyme M protein
MAVRMIMATYQRERRLKLKVLDPACGTGGFLRAALLSLRDVIDEQEASKWGRNKEKRQTTERLRRLCDENIFGIDKLAELVRAAQMNLAMHGDGSSNISHANSLLPPGEWPENVRRQIGLGRFDVVFTNPPFGSRLPIDDPHILEQFELSRAEAKAPRSAMPPEQLFVERCLQFLKPGGRMAIVLPDSILSNPGLAWLRRWILKNAWIIASVDLPREMFAKSDTHTMTSVLFLQKFTVEERRMVAHGGRTPDYEIFMAIADRVGWDLRGQPVYLRTEEGEEILRKTPRPFPTRDARGHIVEMVREVEEPIIHDQLPKISEMFVTWLKDHRAPWLS